MNDINFNDYAIQLSRGSHPYPEAGMCVMECVAYIAGEPHTDRPKCADPELARLAIYLNDKATCDSSRQRLLPFVLRLAGSAPRNSLVLREREIAVNCYFAEMERALLSIEKQRQKESEFYSMPKNSWVEITSPNSLINIPMEWPTYTLEKSHDQVRYAMLYNDCMHRFFEMGLDLLDRLLPPADHRGYDADVVPKKLHELVTITHGHTLPMES